MLQAIAMIEPVFAQAPGPDPARLAGWQADRLLFSNVCLCFLELGAAS